MHDPSSELLQAKIAAKVVSASFGIIAFVVISMLWSGINNPNYGIDFFGAFDNKKWTETDVKLMFASLVSAIILHHLRIFFGVSFVDDNPTPGDAQNVSFERLIVVLFLISYPVFPYLVKLKDPSFLFIVLALQHFGMMLYYGNFWKGMQQANTESQFLSLSRGLSILTDCFSLSSFMLMFYLYFRASTMDDNFGLFSRTSMCFVLFLTSILFSILSIFEFFITYSKSARKKFALFFRYLRGDWA